jgi:hypothetical protein
MSETKTFVLKIPTSKCCTVGITGYEMYMYHTPYYPYIVYSTIYHKATAATTSPERAMTTKCCSEAPDTGAMVGLDVASSAAPTTSHPHVVETILGRMLQNTGAIKPLTPANFGTRLRHTDRIVHNGVRFADHLTGSASQQEIRRWPRQR